MPRTSDDGETSPQNRGTRPLIEAARAQVAAAQNRHQLLLSVGKLPSAVAIEGSNRRLGNYTLRRELHRGGQGVVYLAVQETTGREVAVKVLRHGSTQIPAELNRFEREIEALSRLKHPNVVTIHDCGRSDEDVFLVMDYVAGRTLDAYIAQQKLQLNELLELFAKISDGVNAAHLRGVIHRDLKPNNIRVDEHGEPRILDFGLAKLQLDARSNISPPSMTETGQFVGSLPWSSPEQATGQTDSLDIRSDVYSLGVILYQLLTGKYPYPVSGRIDDVIRHITTTDPQRPSSIDKRIGNEIETILLKCLSKEPERRYQSAGELARDLRHYLAGEPIEAKRNSVSYLLRKQLRRYWLPAAISAAFVLVLAGGLVASLSFWSASVRSLEEKEIQRRVAEEALVETEKQRNLADQRATQTQSVADFQSKMLSDIDVEAMGRGIKESFRKQVRSSLERQHIGAFPDRRPRTSEELDVEMAQFDRLTESAFGVDIARQVMDEFVLRRAADALQKQFTEQPLVLAQLQASMGGAYQSLGVLDAAESQWRATLETRRQLLGTDHLLIADALNELAMILQERGQLPAAEALYREALDMRRRLLGNDHTEVAKVLSNLGNLLREMGKITEAEPLLNEALALQRKLQGAEHEDVASALNNVAALLHTQGKLAEAEPAYRECIEIYRKAFGDSHLKVVDGMSNLGVLLNDKGDYKNAETLNREVLALQNKLHGHEHSQVARALNTLAYSLHQQGRFSEAEPLYREALAMRRRLSGDVNPDVGRALNNLATVLGDMGEYDESERLLREALEVRIKSLGEDHPDVARTLNNLAKQLMAKGDHQAAIATYQNALERRRKAIGKDDHPDVARGLANLATALSKSGDYVAAETMHREALAIRRRIYGTEHPEIALNLQNLASTLADQEKYEEADAFRQEALAMQRKLLGDQHPQVALSLHNMASNAKKRGNLAQAEELYREALAIYRARYKGDHPEIFTTSEQLAATLIDMNRLSDAEPLIVEAMEMSGRKFPGDHEYRAIILSTYALFLFHRGENDEARKTIDQANEMILRIFPAEHRYCQKIDERRTKIYGE